jgi:hypothetical protein
MFKLFILSFFCLLPLLSSCEKKADLPHSHTEKSVYTCPMHPEVREQGPGSCPICGMPLVEESGKSKKGSADHLLPSDYQKKVLNFTKTQVEKKDIQFTLPISGRITGSNEITFSLYESDMSFVSPGLSFEGKVSGSEKIRRGVIISVDRIADPSSHTVRVVGRIQSGGPLSPIEGSFFGNLEFEKKTTLMIPSESVLRTGEKNIVYLINEDSDLKPVSVKLGQSQGDEIEVLGGLSEGDEIAAGPNFLLDSEARLKGIHD